MDVNLPFVGRSVYIKRVEKEWQDYKLFGIYGLRSVGKSRLVHEILLRQRNRLSKHSVSLKEVWIDLRKSSSLRRIYLNLCEKLKLGDVGFSIESLLAELHLRFQDEINVVIVFDNAEDVVDNPGLIDEFKNICLSLIQNGNPVTILITSTSDPEFTDDIACKIDLPVFSALESETLLRTAASNVEFGACVPEIVKLCEGLPLALLMVAAELDEQKSGLFKPEEVVMNLTQHRLKTLSGEFYPKGEQIEPLYTRFIERLPEHERESLAILGYIPSTFNLHQASRILDQPDDCITMDTVLRPMTKKYVTQYDPINKRFDIHGILRDCMEVFLKIKDLPEVRKRFCMIFSAILQEIIKRFRTEQYVDALATFNVEHQNFQKLLTDVIYSTEDTYPVFIDLACKATGEIQYFMAKEGLHFYEECIRLCMQNKMKVDEALVRVSFGAALTNIKGDLKSGEENYKKAIEVIEKVPFTNSRYQLAFTYQRLGWNVGCQGKIQEALRILTKAWELENELHLQYDTLILQTLNSLGIYYVLAGNFDEAEKFHFDSLKRRIEVYRTEDHPFIGAVYNNIGELYIGKENFELAEEYYRKGLEIKLKTNARDQTIVMSQINVATSLARKGEYDQAFEILEDAKCRLSKHPGLYKDVVAIVSDCEGQILYKQKRFKEAVSCLENALQIRRKEMPSSVLIVESLLELGKCYIAMQKYNKAKKVLTEGLELKASVSEMPTTTSVIQCYERLTTVYQSLEDNFSVRNLYGGHKQELCRLINVYKELGNKQKMQYYNDKLKELEENSNAQESAT